MGKRIIAGVQRILIGGKEHSEAGVLQVLAVEDDGISWPSLAQSVKDIALLALDGVIIRHDLACPIGTDGQFEPGR